MQRRVADNLITCQEPAMHTFLTRRDLLRAGGLSVAATFLPTYPAAYAARLAKRYLNAY